MLGFVIAQLVLPVLAAAVPTRRSVMVLSSSEIGEWTDPAYFASAAYCPGNTITAWDCGTACLGVTKPTILATGGDGGLTPRFYVATLPDNTILVGISGTNVSSALSIAIDLDFVLTPVSTSDFSGENGIEVHDGFLGAFERMKSAIESAVKGGVSAGATEVLVTGHSLGGALTTITATYLQKLLGSGVTVTAKAFASPRVGNQAWADYVDATLGSNAQHMINFDDDVPHVPPRDWGFQQSSNEIWISENGATYELCSGQENPQCSDSLESGLNILALIASFVDELDTVEHSGPYAGVTITSSTCSA